MYPTVVIALVYSQRSMTDNYDLSTVSTTSYATASAAPPAHGACGTGTKLVTGDTAQGVKEERR